MRTKQSSRDNRDLIRQENGYEQLRLGDDDFGGNEDEDESAMEKLINHEMMSIGSVDMYQPLQLSRDVLRSLEPTSVLIQKWEEPRPWQFHWMRLKQQPITVCPSCQQMFLTDDWFLASLSKGYCPFCRSTSNPNETQLTSSIYSNAPHMSTNSGYLNGVL